MADPPCCLQNSAFLFPASLPQTSNTLTFDREKNTSFDSILQRLYLQKKSEKKKIPFPGRRQRMEQEPGKLLLIHAKLHSQHRTVFLSVFHPFHTVPTSHSHMQKIYTPTHPSFKEFVPSCSKHPAHAHSASRETPSFYV